MSLYEFSALEWSQEIENKILIDTKDPKEVVDSWKIILTEEEMGYIDTVLASSPLTKLWELPIVESSKLVG
jgi:hypothetical protein